MDCEYDVVMVDCGKPDSKEKKSGERATKCRKFLEYGDSAIGKISRILSRKSRLL